MPLAQRGWWECLPTVVIQGLRRKEVPPVIFWHWVLNTVCWGLPQLSESVLEGWAVASTWIGREVIHIISACTLLSRTSQVAALSFQGQKNGNPPRGHKNEILECMSNVDHWDVEMPAHSSVPPPSLRQHWVLCCCFFPHSAVYDMGVGMLQTTFLFCQFAPF